MNSVLLMSIAAVFCAGRAFAGDTGPPVYAQPPPAPPSWTGLYVGLNAGTGGGGVHDNHYSAGTLDATGTLSSSGFMSGGTAGFNYQFPQTDVVLGVEGDFDGSTVSTHAQAFSPIGGAIRNDTKLDWFSTAGARIGYAFGDILPYVTGGAAFGHIDAFSDPFGAFSVGSTQTGWTAGAGIEYQVNRNLSVKAEYLHVDLDRDYYQTPGDLAAAPASNRSTHPALNVVRAGVNWKFEWLTPPIPVVPKY